MSNEKKFRIRICSDLDYEEMVADVVFKDFTLAIISQENGIENMEIEIFNSEEQTIWKLPLDDFLETILRAQKRLKEMQKKSDD